jgi:hypothetical protein
MCPADGRVGNVVTVVMVLADIPIAPTGIYAYLFRHQRPGLPFFFFFLYVYQVAVQQGFSQNNVYLKLPGSPERNQCFIPRLQ